MRLFKNFKPTKVLYLNIPSAKNNLPGEYLCMSYRATNGEYKDIKARKHGDCIVVYTIKKVNNINCGIRFIDGIRVPKDGGAILNVYRIPLEIIKALELNVIQHNRHFTIE